MNTSTQNERRRFNRILFDAPVTISCAEESYSTTLIDISLKGALFNRPDNWQSSLGDEISLEVTLNNMETVISMHAVCAHEEDQRIGVLCKEIDMESIIRLRRLIELNVADEDRLQRDLEALG
jgi:c-di-GMP-binding flagellar brake protein YcgR